jgi:large conductance mechanosensitive channel
VVDVDYNDQVPAILQQHPQSAFVDPAFPASESLTSGTGLGASSLRRCFMASGNDPFLDRLGMAHLGSPKAFLGKKGGVLGEFRDFALRGSMLDMAVGIIIGAAFGRVVSSFVSDILMPPIGLLSGHSDFSNKFINLSGQAYATLAEAKAAGAATLNYGVFLNVLSDFLIVALAVFLLIRQVNRLKTQPGLPAVATRECPFCVSPVALKATRCPHCTSMLTPS